MIRAATRSFLASLAVAAPAMAQSPPAKPSIADLEKQLADLQKQIDTIKSTPVAKKKLSIADEAKWRRISASSLSPDGQWHAHRVGPAEGAGEVILTEIATGKATKYPGGGSGTLAFSPDSKWFVFGVNPVAPRTAPAAPGTAPATAPTAPTAPPPAGSVVLVKLESMEKNEFEGIRSFTFNGDAGTVLAMRKGGDGGNDLLLRDLATGSVLTLGNVGDYAFTKKGDWLVMTIDSKGLVGNGVQLRDMTTGAIVPLETDKATYSSLSMNEETTAFTVLKGIDDAKYEGKVNVVLGFTSIGPKAEKVVYDFRQDKSFPADTGVSGNRAATWSESKDAIYFGLAEQKKRTGPPTPGTGSGTIGAGMTLPPGLPPEIAERIRQRGIGGTAPGATPSANRPDLVVWHWKDDRLQPQQQVQASFDKMRTSLAAYRVAEKKFVRYGDDKLTVSAVAKQPYGLGFDGSKYQLQSTLDGKRFQDVYRIDLATGERKLIAEKVRYAFGVSPTGRHLLHYADGHFRALDIATGTSVNITEKVNASFIDVEDDHNVDRPPSRPGSWTTDGKFIILSDRFDLWKVAVDGSGGANLTGNGTKEKIRYGQIVQFDPDLKGLDFSKPAFVTMTGELTKKSGFGKLDAAAGKVTPLVWEDASVRLAGKAKNADVYQMTKETFTIATNVYVAAGDFSKAKKVTDSNPQQADYLWSAGAKLIDYKTTTGEPMQAAVFLPADYKPGTKYPTVVYIYERLTQNLHNYVAPGSWGLNPSIYTSNGYVVLMPDIRYRLNDPGVSAVECVIPALDAAIAAGYVDGSKVGLQGHSWGGYQTAFLVTQTDRFKAAIAGAPLTDLVSMYSSVYWNSGSANQPIFESSQGRFTGGYWEQQEAYIRNSPVYHATKVKTPLVILHNDKDGAVDFTQGVEYFNTLRRLGKPVVMLQYKGENHGLVVPANRRDYSTRMKEFFDHHLTGAKSPDWWTDGVPHLKMDEHLKGRAKP
jgi:dipeptidyl aminopeptidase/acylaminoacyl peptidase